VLHSRTHPIGSPPQALVAATHLLGCCNSVAGSQNIGCIWSSSVPKAIKRGTYCPVRRQPWVLSRYEVRAHTTYTIRCCNLPTPALDSGLHWHSSDRPRRTTALLPYKVPLLSALHVSLTADCAQHDSNCTTLHTSSRSGSYEAPDELRRSQEVHAHSRWPAGSSL
jgi:hypothetical protein